MSFFSKVGDFFTGEDPSKKANKYLEQIPGMERDIYNPYINQGQEAYGNISAPLGQMASDPAAFLENLMKMYQPSTQFNLLKDAGLKAGGAAAAAGGTRGGIDDISNQAHIVDSLMGNDMQQWLQNVLGIQGTGLAGEQGIYGQGYNASNALGGDLANVLGSQASLAFQGQAQKNANRNSLFSGLTGGIGAIAGLPTAGGGSVGGNFLSKFM